MDKKSSPCPICGKPSTPQYHPFCSKKCADIDLGRWLKGTYVVHTNETPETNEFPEENNEDSAC
ncbi:MAG: DNA gyrase inhibitor YacG [Alphaproteobacteria bacterium]|nr:DNA gyrase inhibitor YacG [Alphaproteobacteria bacterium]